VTPLPAILALRNSWVHVCFSDRSDVVANIKAPVDKHFSILAAFVKIAEGELNFYLALSFLFYFLFHFQSVFLFLELGLGLSDKDHTVT